MNETIKALVEKHGLTAVANAAMVTERTIKLQLVSSRNVMSSVRVNRAKIKLEGKS